MRERGCSYRWICAVSEPSLSAHHSRANPPSGQTGVEIVWKFPLQDKAFNNPPECCQTALLSFFTAWEGFYLIRDFCIKWMLQKKRQQRVFQIYDAKCKDADFKIVPDAWTYLFVCFFSANKLNVGLPVGQHLYSGIRRHVSRNSPWPPICFPLHCVWNNPERHAHLHSLQQILRLLQQAEGLRVHGSQERKREGGLHTESHEETIWMLWRRCNPPSITALIQFVLWILGGNREAEGERRKTDQPS